MTARPTRPTTIFSTRTALCVTLGVALLASTLPARAADDDVPLDTKIIRKILEGIGLKRDGEGINYEERAPLVIPPSHALPPPENTDAAVANNPAWPKDPDVQRRKQEAAQERSANLFAGDNQQEQERVLRPDELARGTKPRSKAARDDGYRAPATGYGNQLSPSQLGTKSGLFSTLFSKEEPESGRFTGEPPRTALTEPPPGYQTPSPEQPYGVGVKASTPKATDYLTTHVEGEK